MGDHVQTDRESAEARFTGVVEQPQALDTTHAAESRGPEEPREKLVVESDLVVVVCIDMPAEHHAHQQEALLHRQGGSLDEQTRKYVHVRHADEHSTTGYQHAVPLAQRACELELVVEMLDHMRRIDLHEGRIGKA